MTGNPYLIRLWKSCRPLFHNPEYRGRLREKTHFVLLDYDPVRTRWPSRECRVKVEIEFGIKNQILCHDFGNVDLVVAFRMDLAEVIFVQEVIADNAVVEFNHF